MSNYYGINSPNTTSFYNYTAKTNSYTLIHSYDHSVNLGMINKQDFTFNDFKNGFAYANHDIYYSNGTLLYSSFVEPYIENSTTDINSWSFENFSVNYGSLDYDNRDYLHVFCFGFNGQSSIEFDLNLSKYVENVGLGGIRNPINIPQQRLNNSIVFQESFNINFYLIHYVDSQGNTEMYRLSDSPYSVSISSTLANELNDNADRNIQNDILNTNQQIIDSINNTDFDDNDISMPTIEVNDGGIINSMAGFFDTIYNGFVNGTLYDIVIPIPYTNKNITIPYNYTETQLTNANATYLITLIQLGWWYILGRFMVVNIFGKVIMLMRGSIEKVQMQNVTTQLL